MARRCGSRIAGGVYVEIPLGPGGRPIEEFICDPAILLPAGLDLPKRGMVLRENEDGVNILYDWVGTKQYPNVLDFVEEVRQQGLSRRIPSNFDFGELNPNVRYVAIHERGYVHNEKTYRMHAASNPLKGDDASFLRECPWNCPKGTHELTGDHDHPCSGVWWQDIIPGTGMTTHIERIVGVPMTEGGPYLAMERPMGVVPQYSPAIILQFPVVKLAVIRGNDGEHEKPFEKASKAAANGVRVELEDA